LLRIFHDQPQHGAIQAISKELPYLDLPLEPVYGLGPSLR